MKSLLKHSLLSIISLLLVTACGSASSDAKKVEIKKVAAKTTETTTANSNGQDNTGATDFVEGKHYVEIFPQMQTDAAPGKVEVIELMWLGCPHCYHLEPEIIKYKKNLPDYVDFKQVPAMLNPTWSADANVYYIAEILDPKGEKDLVNKIFKVIHEQRRRISAPSATKRFFEQEGFTAEQVDNARNSMAFQAKLVRAQEIGRTSQAQSVPSLIVNGKYRTSPYMAGGNETVMKVVNMLTEMEKNSQ